MALFNFTCTVPNEGTTFVLGSWICIANSLGGFNSHLADFKRPEASAATQRDDLDEFIDNVDEVPLPYLAREIVRGSVFNATSTHAAPSFLSSDPIHSVPGNSVPDLPSGYATRLLPTKQPCTRHPSPCWRIIWIDYSRSESRKPLLPGGSHIRPLLRFG